MYNIWKKRAEEGYFFNTTLADLKNSALLQVLKADETNRFQSGPNFGKWMQHFFSIVREFYLVVYTDEPTLTYMKTRLTINIHQHPRIRVILKPLESLYHYQYKDFWIKNAEKNVVYLPNGSWELMMIWCEKIAFVKECIDHLYFDTPYYGWCDIGIFVIVLEWIPPWPNYPIGHIQT